MDSHVESHDWFSDQMLSKYSDIKTINGLITNFIGEIPVEGSVFELELCILRIERSEANRISLVSLTRRRTL